MNDIGIALVHPLVLDGKNLFLKKQNNLFIWLGETKLVLTSKPPPYWLAFIVLEGAMSTAGRKQVIGSLSQLYVYSILVYMVRNAHKFPLMTEKLLTGESCEKKRNQFSLGMWYLVGWPCTSGWIYTHLYKDSIN